LHSLSHFFPNAKMAASDEPYRVTVHVLMKSRVMLVLNVNYLLIHSTQSVNTKQLDAGLTN